VKNFQLKLLNFSPKQQTKARGKTNTELREEFILAAGVSQTMQAFTPRPSISAASPTKVSVAAEIKTKT
jgi:dystonin